MPLILPSHRYEVQRTGLRRWMDWSPPSLSKSAPCNCCGHPSFTNCTDCLAALPNTFKVDDSYYGVTFTLTRNSGHGANVWSIDAAAVTGSIPGITTGALVCANYSGNITAHADYLVNCASHVVGGVTHFFLVATVNSYVCTVGRPLTQDTSSHGTDSGSSGFVTDVTSSDCSLSSSISIPISSMGNFAATGCSQDPFPRYYPTGTTLTLHT